MRNALAACVYVVALTFTSSAGADDAASGPKCGQLPPDKRVAAPRPPPKAADIQETSVQCGSITNTLLEPSNPAAKGASSPEGSPGTLHEILDALIKLVVGLAWPVAAVVIVRVLHKEIAALLSRLKRGKWGDLEVEFADRVRAAEEEAEIQRTPETQAVDAAAVAKATSDPRGAILSAWLEVEAALNHVVEVKQLAVGYSRIAKRPLTSIRLVQGAGLLSANYIGLFHDLRAMRNEVAHSVDFSPPPDAVIRYVQLATELAAELLHKAYATSGERT